MLENNVYNVSYIALSFISMINRCCLILCYFFMFVGGIYYRLFNFFSFLFSNMYISSRITCFIYISWKNGRKNTQGLMVFFHPYCRSLLAIYAKYCDSNKTLVCHKHVFHRLKAKLFSNFAVLKTRLYHCRKRAVC